jgi:AcrR family transcriptional regulator
MTTLSFKLNEKLYLRDPQHTDLGRKIIQESITLIDSLGFEQFTFKKLAEAIHSTEASVYRYFENKHRLLLYLTAWYWNWIEYRIDLLTHPSQKPEEKIKYSLQILTEEKKFDPSFDFVNEEALYRIILVEQDKTYLTKWVDDDNSVGFFLSYKSICKKIAGFIHDLSPKYPNPNTLVSTVMVAAHQQIFYAQHLPSLTNIKGKIHSELLAFLEHLVFSTIKR